MARDLHLIKTMNTNKMITIYFTKSFFAGALAGIVYEDKITFSSIHRDKYVAKYKVGFSKHNWTISAVRIEDGRGS